MAVIKIIITLALLAGVFGMLFGPALWVATRLRAQGDLAALRCLRIVWPSQLIGGAGLCFVADFIGLSNPAACVMAILLATSIGGAALFGLSRRAWLAWSAWRA